MDELHVELLQGRWGGQVEYRFSYPQTAAGTSPFDRFWRSRAVGLQARARREPGRFPTVFSAGWQQTRLDDRWCSGFLEVSRRVGHADWTLWRIAGTFGPKSRRSVTLNELLGSDWQRTLQPMILKEMQQIAEGETPFFRGWQRRCASLLRQGRFYLTDQGLCLWFPQDALAPKNAGLPTVLLPYDTLDILRPLC